MDTISNDLRHPEFGVFNIDTREDEPLVGEGREDLLKMTADIVTVAFSRFPPAR